MLELAEPGETVATRLAKHGIMAGGGSFYAVRPLTAMGMDPHKGVPSLSFLHYTTPEETETLITAPDREL